MIVEPKVKGFICTTAHKTGCFESVKRQIDYVKGKGKISGAKRVLILGASTGYGLASRICAAFQCGSATLGVMFEKEAFGKRTATAGWYQTKAFEQEAKKEGLYAKTLNGDAFSQEMKQQVIETIKADLKKVDLVIYSIAAPKRVDTDGTVYQSVLKTIGQTYTNKTLNLRNNEVTKITIEPASKQEEEATVKVMGGEDWKHWIEAFIEADVLEDPCITLAYSYLGPELTYPIYKDGTIGKAKKDLYQTAVKLNQMYEEKGLKAYISVNKALVTQASAAIPIVPLYLSLLYRVMKEKGLHEGCIEQMERLFREKLFVLKPETDELGRIRMDDWELKEEIQKEISKRWEIITTENLREYADIDGYWEDFYHMFGFGYDTIDYGAEIEV